MGIKFQTFKRYYLPSCFLSCIAMTMSHQNIPLKLLNLFYLFFNSNSICLVRVYHLSYNKRYVFHFEINGEVFGMINRNIIIQSS